MVFFVIPIVTFFTGLIGGATLHFVRDNNNENQDHDQNETHGNHNNEEQNSREKRQLIEKKERKKDKFNDKNQEQEKRESNKLRKCSKNQYLSESSSTGSQRKRFTCPLSKRLICDPAQLLCGHYFEKKNILQYLQKYKKCPVCQKKSRKSQIYYSGDFKNMIEKYRGRKQMKRQFRKRMIDDFGSLELQWDKVIQQKKSRLSKNKIKKHDQVQSEGQDQIIRPHYYFNDY